MHRSWGNIDGVGKISLRFSTEKCRPKVDTLPRSSNICRNATDLNALRHAEGGVSGKPLPLIAKMSQETLAEMIGTTRSRVSFFMNRFRDLGFIDYDGGGMHVHSSLVSVVLHD
jgi:CRP/FNR family cyclic AMP-dependent transcriptional regulator